jgi:electron transport complex protein RnfB
MTLLSTALVLAALTLALALGLHFSRQEKRLEAAQREARIALLDATLPQTQCGQCGYSGCRPYAEALLSGAAHTLCAPGGQAGVGALATLLGRERAPLDAPEPTPLVAVIREAECIGCTKCIQACPVDAILGAAQRMHSVIEPWCTGCDLCVDPCPVDCIDLVPRGTPP